MVSVLSEARVRAESREGFAIPAVIFALVMMSLLAIVSLVTARDEELSSRAVRESSAAFYAAQSGVNYVRATWHDSLVSNLGPGDSLDLGWQSLEGGAAYRAVVYRYDNEGGAQKVFGLITQGRGAGFLAPQRVVGLDLTPRVGPILITAAIRGGAAGADVKLDELGLGGVTVSGRDTIPAGWGGTCSNALQDKPGLEWSDTTSPSPVEVKNDALLEGDPALVEDATIDSAGLFDWGIYGYDSLTAMATNTYPGGSDLVTFQIAPTESSPGVCGVSDVDNWGAPEDPSHSCFSHFPIIHVTGDLRIRDGVGVGQGILLVDGDLRIEDSFTFYGIMFVQGEARLEDAVTIYGAVVSGGALRVENGATVRYSQCAVNRALALSALQASVGGVQALYAGGWSEGL